MKPIHQSPITKSYTRKARQVRQDIVKHPQQQQQQQQQQSIKLPQMKPITNSPITNSLKTSSISNIRRRNNKAKIKRDRKAQTKFNSIFIF